MAVSGNNPTLFRCVFRSRYRVRSAIQRREENNGMKYYLSLALNIWPLVTLDCHAQCSAKCVSRANVMQVPYHSTHAQYKVSRLWRNATFTLHRAWTEMRNGIMFDFKPVLPRISSGEGYQSHDRNNVNQVLSITAIVQDLLLVCYILILAARVDNINGWLCCIPMIAKWWLLSYSYQC